MNIYDANEKALRDLWKGSLKEYEKKKEKQIQHCVVEENSEKEKVICCFAENREWRLNSIYNPEHAATLYAQRYGKIKDFSVLCIFGLSDGKSVRKLLENCNETQTIVIYEPDYEVFLMAMEHFVLDDIFVRENLYLIVNGINENRLPRIFEDIITYQNHLLIRDCILPNYDILYYNQAKEFLDTLLYYSRLEVFKKNTDINYGKRLADNLLYNLPYMIKNSSVTELKSYMRQQHLEEIPAIIVSAGPSLDKNIKELKKAEGKAFIIGVDSALKALVREKINFQIAVSVDPRKNPDVFADERVNEYPYLVSGYSIPLIAEKNRNRLFYEGGYGFEGFEEMIIYHTGKRMEDVRTGGSVATDAFSLAVDLGFHKIIMVGQDLAFTGGKGHVSGFEKSEEADREHVANSMTVEVEAYGGGKIVTDIQMESYKRWFELRIQELKDSITVYNATEGGAHIDGTIEMTLQSVLKECCKESQVYDFDKILQEVPQLFSEQEKKRIIAVFLDSTSNMDKLEDKLKAGILSYEKIISMENQNLQNTSEYKQLLQQIYEVNRIEKTEKFMYLIKLYAKQAEYEATDDIYEAEDLSIKEIAERGKALLEGYIEGIHTCKGRMEEILIPELKKMSEE